MSFEELIHVVKTDLDKPGRSTHQFNETLRSLDSSYLTKINKLIEQLNKCLDAERSGILKQIKETDKLYLEAKGTEITGHILFSRHGRCAGWGQKKFGLSPNSTISEAAAKNMSTSSQSTSDLLFYSPGENPPYIAISPMNRPLQTAGFIIPKEIQNAEISIEAALAENSNVPSGFDVRSRAEMQKLYDETSFWKSPITKIFLKISMWCYGDKYFEQLYLKRKEAAEKVQTHGSKILTAGDEGHPDVPQELGYDSDKITDIKALMKKADQRDCWFFGHGANFKAFFKDVLGIKSDFDYAETRSVYKVKSSDGSSSLFSPPYAMVINQDTGKIEGKYTAKVAMALVKGEERIPEVSEAMSKLGSSVSSEELADEPVLSAKEGLFLESPAISVQQSIEPSSVNEAIIK